MTPPDTLAPQAKGVQHPLPAAPETPGPTRQRASARARRNLLKYRSIFTVSLKERMTYRGDFLLGTILRFLPMVTTILLWHASCNFACCRRSVRLSSMLRLLPASLPLARSAEISTTSSSTVAAA